MTRHSPILVPAFASCVALHPQDDNAEGYRRIGRVPYRNEDYRKAAAHLYLGTAYSMAYQTSPNAAGLAIARKAVASFQRVLELSPDNSVVRASLDSLA